MSVESGRPDTATRETVDTGTGAGYLRLRDSEIVRQAELGHGLFVDIDSHGRIVGIESLDGQVNRAHLEQAIAACRIDAVLHPPRPGFWGTQPTGDGGETWTEARTRGGVSVRNGKPVATPQNRYLERRTVTAGPWLPVNEEATDA